MATMAMAMRVSFPSYSLPLPPRPPMSSPRTATLRSLLLRPPTVCSAVAAAAAPPQPTRSTTGIVLVDRSEAEKVHRLKAAYLEMVVPLLKEEFSYENIHEVPKIEKIVVNCGMGDAEQNSKGLEAAMKDLTMITGQRPVKTKAKNSIASFKLREGATVGIAVTLRGNAHKSRAPSDEGFPRREPQQFRRPWELQHRLPRSERVSRDQVRSPRKAKGDGRLHYHHRQD